jgi:predicted CoA-binding protein
MHTNPSDAQLTDILRNARTIAMVGASSREDKPSNRIMKQLQRAGYKVIPVNPKEAEILGERAYSSLIDIPEPVDIVDVFRRAEDAPPIADDAVKMGAKTLWLQEGIASEDAAARAGAAGLNVVMNACIGATIRRLDVRQR